MNEQDTETKDAGQVYASFDCDTSCRYFIRGKKYPVLAHKGCGFWIENEVGTNAYCLWEGCGHISDGNWTRHDPPDAGQVAHTHDEDMRFARAAIIACNGIPTEALEAGVIGDMVEVMMWASPVVEAALGADDDFDLVIEDYRAAIAKLEGKA